MTPTLAVGCLAGAALWSVVRLAWSRDGLTEHLTALYRPPATRHTHHRRLVAGLAERFGVTIGTSLTDDLIVVGRTPDAHLTARVTHLSAAVAVTVTAVAIAVGVGVRVPVTIVTVLVVFAAVAGWLVADHRVTAAARARRRELRQAVAAYLDLVRTLVAGHLPVNAAVTLAADPGGGWAFTEIRAALAWAGEQHLAVSVGFEHLADRYPLPELRDLAATVSVAERRGGDPIRALGDRAGFLRGADLATTRAELAAADAAIQLPAVVIALGFLAFIAIPLVELVTTIGTHP